MADRTIRVGRVSRVNYETGMISVTYPDLDGATSAELSMLDFGGEYKMPKPGDNVAVACLSSDPSRGVVMGTYWNRGHNSRAFGRGYYRKEYAERPGESYMDYDPETKTLTIFAPNVTIKGNVNIIGSLKVNGTPVP